MPARLKPKLPDFNAAKQDALRDGKVDAREANKLMDVASARINNSINPGATLDKYQGELDALASRAVNPQTRDALQSYSGADGFAVSRQRMTELADRAVVDVGNYLQKNQGNLPHPLNLIVTDKNAVLQDVINTGTLRGGLVSTDDASDAQYVAVPIDASGIRKPNLGWEDAQQIEQQLIKAIQNTPELAHLRGADFQVVLTRPAPALR